MATQRLCSIPDCGKTVHSRDWCIAHYRRWQRHGDPLAGRLQQAAKGEPARYFNEVVLAYDGDECLIWPYARNNKGYGLINNMRYRIVSRLVCEHANGPPPTPEYEGAHSCGKGHEGCVTRGHLSWKTSIENKADALVHGARTRGETQHP